jgi:hypothetical protein
MRKSHILMLHNTVSQIQQKQQQVEHKATFDPQRRWQC